MENNRFYFVLLCLAVILTAAVFLGNPHPVAAAESCSIIPIRGEGQTIPKNITVEKGDCVVWMNWNHEGQISIAFKEHEKCIKGTTSPVGFTFDEKNSCFVAQWLEFGKTVSLLFTTPGTYNYEIEFNAGGKFKGSVTVKE